MKRHITPENPSCCTEKEGVLRFPPLGILFGNYFINRLVLELDI